MEEFWVFERLFFQGFIGIVKEKKYSIKYTVLIKNSLKP